MNKLPMEKRAQVLSLLVEGNSLRAAARIADISYNTVCKLFVSAGQACSAYQDEILRDLPCKRVQVDEIWSFVYAKQKNVPTAKKGQLGFGDVWTWVALCADTKLVPSWFVGSRDAEHAKAFMVDLASRMAGRIQLTSDGFAPYPDAVHDAFLDEVDYAQLVKVYGESPEAEKRYSPAVCVGARKRKVRGKPDKKHVSTSYVERQNLTMRMQIRRFTRLTNAFSKKLENHVHSISLHYMHYNFVRVHKTLRVTPAMAAGVTDRLWNVEDIVRVIDEYEAKPRMPVAQGGNADLQRLKDDTSRYVPQKYQRMISSTGGGEI